MGQKLRGEFTDSRRDSEKFENRYHIQKNSRPVKLGCFTDFTGH